MSDKTLSLALSIERAESDNDSLTIPVSFASDQIIDDPYLGPVRLSMDPASVDLSAAQEKGIPVRLMHQRGLPMARVEAVRIDGGKLRGRMRFSNSDLGRQLYRDAVDGILTDLSVGAAIYAVKDEKTHTVAMRWMPREVSIVDEGADQSVGIMRSQEFMAAPANNVEVIRMSENEIMPGAVSSDTGKNAAAIMDLARYANSRAPELNILRMGEDFAAFNEPFEAFRSKVWTMLAERQAKEPVTAAPAEVGLSKKEAQEFSITRAALASLTGNWKQAGFELEVSRAVADRLGRPARGFFVPLEVQRTMTAGSNTAGGYLVGTANRGDLFIDSLRAQSVAFQAGAQMLGGLVGNVAIPKKTSSASFYWLSEGEDTTTSDLAFGSVTLSPRTVSGGVPMTRRLLMQSSPDVEVLVRNDLVTGAALALDLAIFEGTGSKQPLGLVNHPDINTVAVSTDSTPTWAEVVGFESAIAADNALTGSLRYVTTPAVRGAMKTTSKDSGSGIFICSDGNTVNGYPLLVSTLLSTSRLLFGDFSQIVVGMWGVLDVKPDESTLAASGGLILRVFQDADVAIRHGESFAVGT